MKLKFIIGIFLSVLIACDTAQAITVTNTNDNGPGSLREAIAQSASGETIDFSLTNCPCSIKLTSGQLVIDRSLTIQGPGSEFLTISGNNLARVIKINAGNIVNLNGLRIADGRAQFDFGECSLGGGILNYGDLTILNSIITENLSPNGFSAGIQNSGKLSLINSTVNKNSSHYLNSCAFARSGGVASFDTNPLVISGSSISGNLGGGLEILPTGLPLTDIESGSDPIMITDSRVADNTDVGIIVTNREMTLDNVEVSGNFIGISSSAILTINNCTVSGNSYAGITLSGILSINHSTISMNRMGVDPANGIDILPQFDDPAYSIVFIKNSIIAGNAYNEDLGGFPENYISYGYNLIGNANKFSERFNQPGDQFGSFGSPLDPRLDDLAFHGGPTKTHALHPNSPAADKGNSFGLFADQRGFFRPSDNPEIQNAPGGDGSDIGAYEISFPLPENVSISGRATSFNGRGVYNASIVLSGSDGTRTARTNPFGYYRFKEIPAGQTYTISVSVKQRAFNTRTVIANEDLERFDFISLAPN